MFDLPDRHSPSEYDRVQTQANEARDAARRVTMRGHDSPGPRAGRSAGRWWRRREFLILVTGIAVLGAAVLLANLA
jgi:hypothetical protein